MKKIACICLLAVFLISSVICVNAANEQVVFTSGSTFKVGGTATVDFQKTAWSVMENPESSEMYNAALEMNMSVMWRCSNGPDKYGKSVTWTAEDAGKEYVCRVSLYLDKELTEFVDYIDSDPFVVAATIPTIKTTQLPKAQLGVYYGATLECSDPNVKWELYRSSLPEGMQLTEDGHLEGTPEKAGEFKITVLATPAAGADYAATASFKLTVEDVGYTMELLECPDKIVYTAGEKLDMTGLKVKVSHHYLGEVFVSVNGDQLTYSKRTLVTVGEQKIFLEYKDALDMFIITVNPAPTPDKVPPKIQTETLPDAVLGKNYYQKLECSDPDAVFTVYMHPEYANDLELCGLYLTQHGEIEGVPTAIGRFPFSVRATNGAGEDIKNFILDVGEGAVTVVEVLQAPDKVDYYSGETLDLTGLKVRVTNPDGTSFESQNGDKLTITTEPLVTLGEQKIKVAYGEAFDIFIVTVQEKPATDSTDPTDSADPTAPGQTNKPGDAGKTNEQSNDIGLWIFAGVGICALLAGGVVLAVTLLKKKQD